MKNFTKKLTVGGTGDVLAGIIAGIFAQNDNADDGAFESACAGTFLNGLAGEILFKKNKNFDAMQLVGAIMTAIKFCREI